jgi:hypothetical protein
MNTINYKKPTRAFIWQVKTGKKFTTIIPLAIEIAKATGKKPISYISLKMRNYVLEQQPELGEKPKRS